MRLFFERHPFRVSAAGALVQRPRFGMPPTQRLQAVTGDRAEEGQQGVATLLSMMPLDHLVPSGDSGEP